MRKKDLAAERKAEELLMALGKELGESRAAFGEALMDENQPDPPMFMTKEEWYADRPMVVEYREPRTTGKLRRVLILAAVLIFVMGIAVVSSDGVKLKKSTVHMEEKPAESTRIIDDTKKLYDLEDFQVGYVPEGYEQTEDHVSGDMLRLIEYYHGDVDKISIHIVKTDHYGLNIDNETAKREEVLVNDKQAYLFQDEKKSILVWQMGDCTIDLEGKLSRDELLSIAKNIYVK